MKKDSKGNCVAVTIFESYFAKLLIENSKIFEEVFQKVLSGLETLIALNASDPKVDRALYAMDTLLSSEFKGYKTIKDLQNKFNLFATNYYIKLFCDRLTNPQVIKQFKIPENPKANASLFILCQYSLFKSGLSPNQLSPLLKPEALFLDSKRGAILSNQAISYETRKLGITTKETTPTDLLDYFPENYQPSIYEYNPKRKSNVGKWFDEHNLPIISGTSGSARDLLSLLFKLVRLDRQEIQLILIAQAATMIAQGHHSYFEVILMLDRIGIKLQSAPNLFAFYEQTLPSVIRNSQPFQEFKHSPNGEALLEDIRFEQNDINHYEELPEVCIGNYK